MVLPFATHTQDASAIIYVAFWAGVAVMGLAALAILAQVIFALAASAKKHWPSARHIPSTAAGYAPKQYVKGAFASAIAGIPGLFTAFSIVGWVACEDDCQTAEEVAPGAGILLGFLAAGLVASGLLLRAIYSRRKRTPG